MMLLLPLVAAGLSAGTPSSLSVALERKAVQLDKIVVARHMREGLVLPTVFIVKRGNPAYNASTVEDACSVTGKYVQTESMRFAVTRSPEARANAARSARALIKLERVTGVPGVVARCFKRAGRPTVDELSFFFPEEWHQSKSMPGYRWLGDLSVDQFNAWMIGMDAFYRLAATPAERKDVRACVSRAMGRVCGHRMRIVDADGKMTLWGNMSPIWSHEHLNSLLALGQLRCAYAVTGEKRFFVQYRTLIRRSGYHDDAVLAKTLFPEWALNGGDDGLGMGALERLLTYEADPSIRDRYLTSMRRFWTVLQYDHLPYYDMIVERHLGGGLDARSLDWLVKFEDRPEGPHATTFSSPDGEVEVVGTWADVPDDWLRAYWYARYHRMLDRATELRVKGAPSRPDPPARPRPATPSISMPSDLDVMMKVHAGAFTMGSTAGDPDEAPVRKVTLPTFWIGKYEVTNLQFRRFDPKWRYPDGEDLRPASVQYPQAAAYAAWIHMRLPTEAEWEKAARGTDGRRWPWGNEYDLAMVALDDREPQGRVTPCVSPYGAVDMAGNAWEWTSSWYDAYPGSRFRNQAMGRRYKVLRAGSSFADRTHTRCAHRYYASPHARALGYATGFRCVSDRPPSGLR